MTITVEQARSLLKYGPISGRLIWRRRHGCTRGITIFNAKHAEKEAGCIQENKERPGTFYRHVRLNGQIYLAHRLIRFIVTGEWPSEKVDHKNGDGLDNSWGNLRDATQQQNGFNRSVRKDNPGRFKGVRLHRDSKRFQARITINYRSIHLGLFDSEEEAAAAYDRAAMKFHGNFALLNLPVAA